MHPWAMQKKKPHPKLDPEPRESNQKVYILSSKIYALTKTAN